MNILEKQQALDTIERLREQKEAKKLQINNLNNEIIQLDMMIRDIRQSIPKMDILDEIPKRIPKQKLTPEQELEQLIKQNEELTRQIEEKKKELMQ